MFVSFAVNVKLKFFIQFYRAANGLLHGTKLSNLPWAQGGWEKDPVLVFSGNCPVIDLEQDSFNSIA